MGTRADFYVGRDPATMEWLGSIAMDGYPEGNPAEVLNCWTEDDYRRRVAEMLRRETHATTPDQGWPWPWVDSGKTDFAYAFDEVKQALPVRFSPSRLFLYYAARDADKCADVDAGVPIRYALKAANAVGVCREKCTWPYDESKVLERPPQAAYDEAAGCRLLEYLSVNPVANDIKGALAAGYPVVFGFEVRASFDSIGSDGVMPAPAPGEADRGGHAVCAVGYDDAKGRLIVRNSWGASWGDAGHFYMPYAVAFDKDVCGSWWAIRGVSKTSLADQADVQPATADCCKCGSSACIVC